jgi:hypothetical protein
VITLHDVDFSPTESDYQALTAAVLRIFLELRYHGNSVRCVTVPDNAFDSVKRQLLKRRFCTYVQTPDTPMLGQFRFFVESASGNQKQTFYYN